MYVYNFYFVFIINRSSNKVRMKGNCYVEQFVSAARPPWLLISEGNFIHVPTDCGLSAHCNNVTAIVNGALLYLL